jgi:hypothetical protein
MIIWIVVLSVGYFDQYNFNLGLMKIRTKRSLKIERPKFSKEKISSYDTTREETSTPQKIREGDEPEAIRQRLEKSK